MRKRLYFLSALLFMAGCLVAQPYSKPPFLYSDITSSGSYDLAGKKFFVSALNYTTPDAAEYNSQKEAFAGYLVESLAMRGAVPVIDSLEADFYVAATLDYRNVSNDVTNYSKESKEFGTNSIKYNGRRSVDNIIEEEKRFRVGADNVTSYGYSKYSDNLRRHKAKMNELSYRNEDIIVKVVTIEAYDWANGSKNSLWVTQAMDSRSAGYIKFLPTDRAMVYLMMRGYVIVGGVLDLILGLFLCIYPGVTVALLPLMLGFWLLYNSFVLLGFSGDFDTFGIQGGGMLTAGGILMLLLSILVLVNPFGAGIATVIVMAGVGLIVFGILLCSLSMKLKGIHLNFDKEEAR